MTPELRAALAEALEPFSLRLELNAIAPIIDAAIADAVQKNDAMWSGHCDAHWGDKVNAALLAAADDLSRTSFVTYEEQKLVGRIAAWLRDRAYEVADRG